MRGHRLPGAAPEMSVASEVLHCRQAPVLLEHRRHWLPPLSEHVWHCGAAPGQVSG